MPDLGYYTLPVIPSIEGIDAQINKSFGAKFGAAGKKASKDFSKGASAGLKDLERDVDAAGKAYQKLKDKAEDSLGKIRSEEEKLKKLRESGASNDRIVAADERLAKARRDSARATRDASDGHAGLLASQKRLGDGATDLGGKFGGLSNIAGTLGISVGGAAAAAGAAAVGGIALLAAGAVRATSELYDLGAQFDDLSDNLRVKTGASGSALDALTNSVENISKSTPASIADIGSVVAETTRALHLTGPELEAVSKNIANLNRLTGEDTNVRGLGKAFRAFGVDAADQVGALDSLFNASQHSGLGVNELIETVVKGGPQLREFGLNFGESAALMGTFEEAGLDAGKSTQGLTKALAGFAKAGKDPQQALQDTITQIKGLVDAGNDAGALDLTNKVFGAKAGVSFFDAVKSGALDLDTLTTSLSTTGDTIQTASDDTADWSERWQELKNKLSVAVEPLASGTFTGLNDGLDELATWVENHQSEIIDFLVGIGDVSITAAEFGIQAFGSLAQGIGELIAPIGDVLGAVNKFQAWQADLRGDHDTANELRAEAEQFFSMGDGLKKIGDAAANANFDSIRNGLHAAGDAAQGASGQIDGVKAAMANLPNGKTIDINAIVVFRDVNGNAIDPSQLITPIRVAATPGGTAPIHGGGRAGGGPILGAGGPTSDVIPIMASDGEHMWTAREVNAVGGQGSMYRLRAAALAGAFKGFAGGGAIGLNPGADELSSIIRQQWPQITNIGGVRAEDGYGEHSSGNALDVMIPNYQSADGVATGNGVLDFVLSNARTMDLKWAIWRDKIYSADGSSKPYGNPNSSDDNAQHRNHVHILLAGKKNTGLQAKAFDASSLVGGGINPGTGDFSGYGSGGSTGVGTNGAAGTYTAPDAKALREANQKVSDADVRVREAEAKQKELEADAKESQKISAQADVDKAKREAEDARADLTELQKGKFTPGKAAKGGQGGLGQFGELGGIAGSFLKETFGIDGSFLPDLSSLGITQMGGNLLNAFKGPLQGLVDGGLGIQQPGWSPGMSVNGVEAPSLFGSTQMPGISDGIHPGSGAAPGPVSIDNSTHINNPQGEPTEKSIQRAMKTRPRIESYALPGT